MVIAAVASGGCASHGRLRDSQDPGFRRSYAASPAATHRALLDALRELEFPLQPEEKGAAPFFVSASVNWTPVAARGRFEADLPLLPHADLACRIEPDRDGGSLLSATVTPRPGSPADGREAVARRKGDVAMMVFNKTQDRLKTSDNK